VHNGFAKTKPGINSGSREGTAVTTLTRRSVVLAAMAAPFAARAQSWPSGNIRLIVPYPAGGSTDAISRLVQPALQQRLGATIVIENRSGASGSIGTAAVAKAAPDGNTWLIVFDNHAANPFVLGNLPFDTEKDLEPVLLIGTAPYALTTHPSRPYQNLSQLIAAAKEKPGAITYASVGSGSVGHLAMALLSKQAGINMIHVPYRGGGPAMNDLIAGHVDLMISSIALVIPQIQGGKMRAVVQTGSKRVPGMPELATVAESGFPGFEANAWWGLFAPARTPKAMVDRFGSDFAACLRDERVSKQLIESQQINMVLGGPEVLRKFLGEQMSVWGTVARENNIKADV
jgi:tripartite-type tricarboxylate transporter receptor subunit TctC